jgi:hypothetical protein
MNIYKCIYIHIIYIHIIYIYTYYIYIHIIYIYILYIYTYYIYILTHIIMIPRQDACAHFAAARPLLQRAGCRDTAWEALKVQPPKMWNQDDMEPTRCLAYILIYTFIG